MARQSGADEPEIQDRINHLEHWAFDLLGRSLHLTGGRCAIEDGRPWGTAARRPSGSAAALDEAARKDLVRKNKLTVSGDAHPGAYLENSRAETGA